MIIGVTATQHGLTPHQRQRVRDLFQSIVEDHAASGDTSRIELHHGDCIGGDAQLDVLGRQFGFLISVHPPSDSKKQAFCAQFGDDVWVPRQYLDRNRDIARACDLLVACPRTGHEELRSGTWATVRYARAMGKPVIIVEPTQ